MRRKNKTELCKFTTFPYCNSHVISRVLN